MRLFFAVGKFFKEVFLKLGRSFFFLQDTVYWLFKSKLEKEEVLKQMKRVGVESFPVCILTSLFTGMVLALQSGLSSKSIFNDPLYVGTLVAFSMVLELGPVLTSIVVAGRVGAAFTAEIGTMKVTEQIDALYTLGVNPFSYLAVPRLIASCLMLPLLVIFSDIIGILGGYFVSIVKLGIPGKIYFDDVTRYLEIMDVLHGIIKTFFFALIIFWVSCFNGFYTGEGAEGVGKATTTTVVVSMILILLSDYFLGSLLISFGIG
ncbi:MAG: ABC transporter permease [Caldiserica bacterium]|nr:MAG: ABC transporter permease [Caldisericota bacterium]